MNPFSQDLSLPDNFDGLVRLFPLPNLVLFPHVVQALHIFEDRYCAMLKEALATDHLITMALMKPGWEKDYDSRPPIESTVCLGKVVSCAETDQGTFNILLAGVRRAKILREVPNLELFRKAEVHLLEEVEPSSDEVDDLRERLKSIVSICVASGEFPGISPFEDAANMIPIGVLVDLIAFGIPMPHQWKQRILAETFVSQRCSILFEYLEQFAQVESSASVQATSSRSFRKFPPKFSDN